MQFSPKMPFKIDYGWFTKPNICGWYSDFRDLGGNRSSRLCVHVQPLQTPNRMISHRNQQIHWLYQNDAAELAMCDVARDVPTVVLTKQKKNQKQEKQEKAKAKKKKNTLRLHCSSCHMSNAWLLCFGYNVYQTINNTFSLTVLWAHSKW